MITYRVIEEGRFPPNLEAESKRIMRFEQYQGMVQATIYAREYWKTIVIRGGSVKTGEYLRSIKSDASFGRDFNDARGWAAGGFVGVVYSDDRKAPWLEEGTPSGGDIFIFPKPPNKFLKVPIEDVPAAWMKYIAKIAERDVDKAFERTRIPYAFFPHVKGMEAKNYQKRAFRETEKAVERIFRRHADQAADQIRAYCASFGAGGFGFTGGGRVSSGYREDVF